MRTVKDILERAVREYNDTMTGNNASTLRNMRVDEKRGILYNCVRRQFQYGRPSYKFTEKFSPVNISPILREDGTIRQVEFLVSVAYNHNPEDIEVIKQMKEFSSIEYLDTKANVNFDNIKNFKFQF